MDDEKSKEVLKALGQFARNSRLLSFLDSEGIKRLAQSGKYSKVPEAHVVVRQKDIGEDFYLVIEGTLKVTVDDLDGREVGQLHAGDFFGEVAMISREPRSATISSTSACTLVAFERQMLLDLMDDYPGVKEALGMVGLERRLANVEQAIDASQGGGLARALEGPTQPLKALEDPTEPEDT